jgi:hypothetical protein
MKYNELKPVLAERVVEVVLTEDSVPVLVCTPKKKTGELELLDAVFGNDVFSKLGDFEVKQVFAVKDGFSLEFEYSSEISKALISKDIIRELKVN